MVKIPIFLIYSPKISSNRLKWGPVNMGKLNFKKYQL